MLNFKTLLATFLGDALTEEEDGVNKFSDYGCYCLPFGQSRDFILQKFQIVVSSLLAANRLNI